MAAEAKARAAEAEVEEGRCQDEEKDAELEPEAAQLQKQVMAGVVRECRAGDHAHPQPTRRPGERASGPTGRAGL